MDDATTFATKAELEQVKKEQNRMSLQLEMNTRQLASLTLEVAHLSERMERVETKVDALDVRFERLERVVADGIAESRASHTALMSAIMGLRNK
jgi:predicted nuclease with TOPRIM domain